MRYQFGAKQFIEQSRLAAIELDEVEARLLLNGYKHVFGDEWIKVIDTDEVSVK